MWPHVWGIERRNVFLCAVASNRQHSRPTQKLGFIAKFKTVPNMFLAIPPGGRFDFCAPVRFLNYKQASPFLRRGDNKHGGFPRECS